MDKLCKKCSRKFSWKTATKQERIDRVKKTFNARVIKMEDGCWDFKGSLCDKGYSTVRSFYSKKDKAHRVSWIIHNGQIPKNMCVLHKCDNRRCSRPEHLFLGTRSDNNKDRDNKKRGIIQYGENHGNAILTVKKVKKIKKMLIDGISWSNIAKKFGVSKYAIYCIKHGRTWKHVK